MSFKAMPTNANNNKIYGYSSKCARLVVLAYVCSMSMYGLSIKTLGIDSFLYHSDPFEGVKGKFYGKSVENQIRRCSADGSYKSWFFNYKSYYPTIFNDVTHILNTVFIFIVNKNDQMFFIVLYIPYIIPYNNLYGIIYRVYITCNIIFDLIPASRINPVVVLIG